MSAKYCKRKSAKESTRAQKGTKERKRAVPHANCKQPCLKLPKSSEISWISEALRKLSETSWPESRDAIATCDAIRIGPKSLAMRRICFASAAKTSYVCKKSNDSAQIAAAKILRCWLARPKNHMLFDIAMRNARDSDSRCGLRLACDAATCDAKMLAI